MKFRYLIFFAVVVLIASSVHLYLWQRLVRDTFLPEGWRRIATAAVSALLIALISSFVLRRLLPLEATRWILFPVYVWMGLMVLLLTALLSGDVVKLLVNIGTRIASLDGGPSDPHRRLFLSRFIGGAAMVGAVGTATFASRSALAVSQIITRRVEVPLRRLPSALDGFRIVQITDLHIGWALGREWLEGVVARVNALQPDLVAITGDLVDGSVEDLWEDLAPLQDLRAKHGVFFCTGNHEYYSGAIEWCAAIPRLGVRVLRNERVSIGEGEASFDLAGVDDFSAASMTPGHGPDLRRAVDGRDPSRELVLLAHQPRAIDEAAELGVGLQVSGHTHGGQMWPMTHFVRLQQPYIAGLADHEGTQIYVSQGTGFWGPPMRLGTTAEITEIRLRSAPQG